MASGGPVGRPDRGREGGETEEGIPIRRRTCTLFRSAVPLSVLALAVGCGPAEKPKDVPAAAEVANGVPAAVPAVEEPYHDATKGAVKFGEAMVSVVALSRPAFDGIPVVSIGLRVECPKDGKPFRIAGWAEDFDLIERLNGKRIARNAAPTPLPVNFRLTTDAKDECRGLSRIILADPNAVGPVRKIESGTLELKVQPGEVYYQLHGFEKPGPAAKMLFFDASAADIGHVGRVKFKIPASMLIK